jgi:hypothetical protein
MNVDPSQRGYGGENSYGVNHYMFAPANNGAGLAAGAIADVSNTLIMVDASYYNVLPRFTATAPACNLAGETPTGIDVTASGYPLYWKNLGNSFLESTAGTPSDLQAEALIQVRYSGPLNIMRADSSAKSMDWTRVTNDTPTTTYTASMWDPYKMGCH